MRIRKFMVMMAAAFSLAVLIPTAVAPSEVAAGGCYTNPQTTASYKIERSFIYIDGTGTAYLKVSGQVCYNGATAYLTSGSGVASQVTNRTGLAPAISRGSFVDGNGTLNVWTDMKFTRSCGGSTFVGYVQLRMWFYKNGGWSYDRYSPNNGACQTAIHWT